MDPFDLKKDNEAPEESAQPGGGRAQVTVSALNMYGEWDLYLNGENIGRIGGHGQVTAAALSQLKNVLAAKDDNGIITHQYEFNIERGGHLEVLFDRGRFVKAHRIDNSAARHASPEGAKPKIWEWLYWAGLTGYCAAVFALSFESIILALALSFIPVLALLVPRFSTHRAMVEYLADNYPEIWSGIARDQYTNRVWGPRDLIFVRDACGDPEYLELRKKHKKVFLTQIFLLCTFIASYFCFVIIATS